MSTVRSDYLRPCPARNHTSITRDHGRNAPPRQRPPVIKPSLRSLRQTASVVLKWSVCSEQSLRLPLQRGPRWQTTGRLRSIVRRTAK